MPPFTKRALYSATERKLQREARSEWKRSAMGRLIEDVRSNQRAGGRASGKLLSALEKLQRGGLSGAISAMGDTSLNGLVQDVIRYSRGGNRGLVDLFLRQLGPAGQVISAIASAVGDHRRRPTTGDRDVDAARDLLEAFGMQVQPKIPQRSGLAQGVEAAKAFLEKEGYEVRLASGGRLEAVPATEESRTSVGVAEPPDGGDEYEPPGTPDRSGMVEIKVGGTTQRFPKDHPIVTKKQVKTPQSSNVWSFIYDVDTRTLYIRFDAPKTKANPSKRQGPLYSYSDVGPDVFLSFMKAESKGGFVWDRIRIRGTVSGHRYSYQLVAVREGYVPRKATLTPTGEWFIKRKINTINRQGVRKTQISKASAPVNRGTPNRGTPNRGRPNRG